MVINETTIQNCYFEKGILSIDSIYYNNYSNILVENSNFINNTAYNGAVLNINEKDDRSKIIFNNSLFENNKAKNFGGIIYSSVNNDNLNVFFNDCKFINNSAYLGNNYMIFKYYFKIILK